MSEVARATTSPTVDAPIDAEIGHPQRWTIMVVLSAVAFMAQLDLFIVNVAIPDLGRSFPGQGLGNLSWVLNAYAIIFAALLVPAGRLADHFGRRRFLLAGIVVFTAASVACAVSPDLAILVAARALQAVGSAMIVPASLGLLLPTFPKRQHGLVVGIWAGVAAVAASAGPPIGGLLVEASWRWVFLVNAPIGVFTFIAGRAVLPEVRARVGAKLPDGVSTISLLVSITLLTLGTVEGSSWGWISAREIALYVLLVIAIAVTLRRTLTHHSPLVEPALFRSRAFTAGTIALVLFFMAFAAWLLGTVLFFENTWHFSTLRAGLAIAPGPLTAAVFALNNGRLAAIFGRRPLAVAGPAILAVSCLLWLLTVTAHPDYLTGFLPGLILAGASSGLTQAPLFASTSDLPPDRATTGSAVLSMARQVGSALGVAIVVALYASANPHLLSAFQRGWIFMAAAVLLASLTSVIIRPRPATRRATATEMALVAAAPD
jgi:EmrB/QacA subfamily drug resistance transporter